METFNLKRVISENPTDWNSFKFALVYKKTSYRWCPRIYVGDRKTKYHARGCGYDKESAVIAEMINDICGEVRYNKKIYGSYDGYLAGGTGFEAIKESFESKRGNKLVKLYSGAEFDVYEITINPKFIKLVAR